MRQHAQPVRALPRPRSATAARRSHELIVGEGADPVTLRGLLSRRGPHTTPTRVLLAAERLTARVSPRRAQRAIEAGRAFAQEIRETIGDGVMLHPP